MVGRRLLGVGGAGLALPHPVAAQAAELPLLVHGNAGRAVWAMGIRVTLKVMGEQTGGAYALFEDEVPPGAHNPAHLHTREIETWYMLEGALDWFVGDQKIEARTGDFVHTPRGLPHRFANTSGQQARMLLSYAPAGFEHWFLEIGTPADQERPWPITQQQGQQAAAAAARYGVQFVR